MPTATQSQRQPELFAKLGAPFSARHMDSSGFHVALLDSPHEHHTCVRITGEVAGWSKAKHRLGKDALEEGDPIIISTFVLRDGALVALEVC